jgi:hypothetical protein
MYVKLAKVITETENHSAFYLPDGTIVADLMQLILTCK